MHRLLGSSVFEVAVTLGGGAGASRTLVKASVPLFDSTVAGVRVAAVKLAVLLLRAGLAQRSSYDKVRTAQQKELDAALAAAAHVPAQAPAEAALPSAREEGRRCGATARQTRCLGRSGCECSDCEAQAVTAKAAFSASQASSPASRVPPPLAAPSPSRSLTGARRKEVVGMAAGGVKEAARAGCEDVRGQELARRKMDAAAAGRHDALLPHAALVPAAAASTPAAAACTPVAGRKHLAVDHVQHAAVAAQAVSRAPDRVHVLGRLPQDWCERLPKLAKVCLFTSAPSACVVGRVCCRMSKALAGASTFSFLCTLWVAVEVA